MCSAAPGITDDVGVSGPEPKQSAGVNASIHAGQDRQVLHGFLDAGSAAQEMETCIHENSVDRVHATRIYRICVGILRASTQI